MNQQTHWTEVNNCGQLKLKKISQITIMLKQTLVLFVLSLIIYADAQGPNRPQGPSCVNSPFKSDGFLLVLNWPIAFCAKNRRGCILDRPVHKWLIHGLWPQFNVTKQNQVRDLSGSPYPQFCCHRQGEFTPQSLDADGLGEKMSRNWFSLKSPDRGGNILTQSFTFWQHEWSKHGTCALSNDGRGRMSQQEYFATTLALTDKFRIGELLTKAKINPSNRKIYSRQSIHQALEPTIDSGALRLSCDRIPQSDGSVGALSEIQICLDLNLQPINCGHLISSGVPRRSIQADTGAVDDHECGESVLYMAT